MIRTKSNMFFLGVVSLAATACTTRQEPITLVDGVEQRATFSSGILQPSDLQPLNIDLCWVDDPNRDMSQAGVAAYEAQKAHFQNLFEQWRENTALTFTWRAQCRAPVRLEDGRDTYILDEVRIFLDGAPNEPLANVLPGRDCVGVDANNQPINRFGAWDGTGFGSPNWSRFPQERQSTAATGTSYCAVNMLLHQQVNGWEPDATFLHEMGHALGLIHEQLRLDTPWLCRSYSTPLEEINLDPMNGGLVLPDETTITRSKVIPADASISTSIQSVVVGFDIVHPRPSDLVVSIVAPNGARAILHNRSNDPLLGTWTSQDTPALAALLTMSPSKGQWSFVVRDEVASTVGALRSWRIIVNDMGLATDNGIYATSYDEDSVMHYGPNAFGACAAPGNYSDINLSDADHLAAEMAYSGGHTPAAGEGFYRDDVPVKLVSPWVVRGASVGTPQLNGGFLNDFYWQIANVNTPATTAAISTTTSLTTAGSLPVGTYNSYLYLEDYWGRVNTHAGTVKVVTKPFHTALMSSSML